MAGNRGIDEHPHASAADRSFVRRIEVVQLEVQEAGTLRLAGLGGRSLGLGLDRAAAHRAPETPRLLDDGPGPGPLRRRALGGHDECHRQPSAAVDQLDDLLKYGVR